MWVGSPVQCVIGVEGQERRVALGCEAQRPTDHGGADLAFRASICTRAGTGHLGVICLSVGVASPARNAPLAWGPTPRGIRVMVVRADHGWSCSGGAQCVRVASCSTSEWGDAWVASCIIPGMVLLVRDPARPRTVRLVLLGWSCWAGPAGQCWSGQAWWPRGWHMTVMVMPRACLVRSGLARGWHPETSHTMRSSRVVT